ncbi:DUF4384 domain-containing protein [Paracraurococcus ruber]|uniref:DUF4384 domain-containing protein n=1 Tax=Paracraurococcus ruber TaxID=77675 RepID=A0ABS1D6M4_9PROT|nr:DUF4384 domain-containing protein [Paracraurococcus ruber]MBK1662148.1 hypothetical protein [Paracraurococcus ruber]TDG16136.1 DUF4384 domain-containing protein [Paracraurococcus ruber]
MARWKGRITLGTKRGVAAALLLLGACHPRPETSFDAQQPRTAAVRNIGNFSESLRCMDDLLAAHGKRDIYITTAGIPDATGLIAAGTKEMFISAVSRMAAKSGGFRFVDYDITQLDVQILSELVGLRQDFVAPSYYIRGAITQLDSNVLSSSQSAGISLARLDLGVSSDQVVSVISMDLNAARLVTRQILPGISASNSIAVVRSGRGADVGGLIGKAGVSFSVSLDKSEGFAQAVRNLVELSTIEVLGKLARVPYWECLSIEPTNPAFRTEARQWFDLMGPEERRRFTEAALLRTGYATNGGDITPAVARYQADHDLVPSGRVDFELYYRLLASDPDRARGTRPAAVPAAAVAEPIVPLPPAAVPAAPRLTLTTARGARPSFRVGDAMVVQARPTADAYLYCYYQDGTGEISRIHPNRFQPDALVPAGRDVAVPPASGAFAIRFDRPGQEQVACLAADREVGLLLPEALKRQDLEPLPVRSLDEIAARFRGMAGVRVEDARLPIEVTR